MTELREPYWAEDLNLILEKIRKGDANIKVMLNAVDEAIKEIEDEQAIKVLGEDYFA